MAGRAKGCSPRESDASPGAPFLTASPGAAQAPRADMTKATSLVKEAEAACKAGNMTLASDKAKAAVAILK